MKTLLRFWVYLHECDVGDEQDQQEAVNVLIYIGN